MFEKVNPMHPDKIADRIAGAVVDMAYEYSEKDPTIAVEVLIGHGTCRIIAETSVDLPVAEIELAVQRIVGYAIETDITLVCQDQHLIENQANGFRCGDNGIFKGAPVTEEQRYLTKIAKHLYNKYKSDGKYILNYGFDDKLIVCQSNTTHEELSNDLDLVKVKYKDINPLGYWTGGVDVDTGATNRKLGSDMGDSVTGGGLMGKDLSKADVSVNIYAFLKAQETGENVKLFCAIGDEYVDGKPYSEIVEIARNYIKSVGGFEKFAEWGLIR